MYCLVQCKASAQLDGGKVGEKREERKRETFPGEWSYEIFFVASCPLSEIKSQHRHQKYREWDVALH